MTDESRRGQLVKTRTTVHWIRTFIPKDQTGTILYELDNGLNQHLLVIRWQDGSTGLVFPSDTEDVSNTN